MSITDIVSNQGNNAKGTPHGIKNIANTIAGSSGYTVGIVGEGPAYIANPACDIPVTTVAPVVSAFTDWTTALTTTNGTWIGDATIVYTYQWKRNGVSIGGETSNTYTLDSNNDSQKNITCEITATNGCGSTSVTSNSTTPVYNMSAETTSLWVDAQDSSTIATSGSDVTQWDDKSGNNYDLAEATYRPVYNATGLNSLPTITFTASNNDRLSTGLTTATINTNTLSVFIMCIMTTSTDANGRVIS